MEATGTTASQQVHDRLVRTRSVLARPEGLAVTVMGLGLFGGGVGAAAYFAAARRRSR